MRKLQLFGVAAVLATIPPVVGGCGDDDDTPPIGQEPTAGTGGTAGSGGASGSGATGGTAAGSGGPGGTGGTAGSAGTAGTGSDGGDAGPVGCPARPATVEALGATIAASRTLTADKVYELAASGTFVSSGATLTIEPCTTVIGGA